MVLRRPINCKTDLGVRKGVVASAPYSYLNGVKNGMAAQFVQPQYLEHVDQVGGFHCFHIDDLKLLAPRWLEATKNVRKNPHRYWKTDGVGEDYDTGTHTHTFAIFRHRYTD